MAAITLNTGRYRKHTVREPTKVTPRSIENIVAVLTDPKKYPSPVRAVGANSTNTRCTGVQEGTILDMRAMNKIVQIKPQTVTVQAGMRLRDLARKLAEHGLELVGSYDQPDRTVGGVISSGALSAGMPDDGGHLAASVCSIQMVTPKGQVVRLDETNAETLRYVRQSFGLLGIICNVTLRIRKIRSYSIRHGKAGFAELTTLLGSLAMASAGVKMYLLPFRDRVFIELREVTGKSRKPRSLAWKIREWLVNKILPDIVYSVGRAFPVSQIRDPLIDGFSEATQMLANTKFVDAGSNAAEQTGQFRKIGQSSRIRYCTWLFPADKFGPALYSYREYCRRHYKVTGFRCDLPAVGYRLSKDASAVLSPSFDATVFAISLRSTNTKGWENFLFDYANIAKNFGGIPLFNQTRAFTPAHAGIAYGKRLDLFRSLRRKADPDNRLLNQFFAEHIR